MGQSKVDGGSGGTTAAPPSSGERTAEGSRDLPSDIWVAVPTRAYDHMARVARDARDLLEALHANVHDLRAGFAQATPPASTVGRLRDIETCCERLNNMLEDALVGVRRDGLALQRSSVSLASVIAKALEQVKTSAEARRIGIAVPAQPDVAARLDRSLLTRAVVTLLGRIISEAEPGAQIGIFYRLERGEISLGFVRNASILRNLPTSMPPGPRPNEAELEFCQFVAECHGGSLTIGGGGGAGSTLYRFDLPWVT